ncbi:hypothetical protein LTR66_011854 [Elasticomyces elasticus]|nr:hypothetical protein LTR28_004696 [Elasticomyces elasticus]KAK4968147.1 hypothetical protein LTR66_011854 [Elasticomyces elasticus]
MAVSRRDRDVNIERCFAAGKHTDLGIHCAGTKFKVHKLILTQYQYFATLLEGSFKEKDADIIDLSADHHDILHALLHYIYYYTYDEAEQTAFPAMIFHIHVYAIADKYNIAGLQALAANKFAKLCDKDYDEDVFSDGIEAVYNCTRQEDRK